MMSGDYAVQVQVESTDEVGELASSFNAMTAAIAEREERISHQALHHRLTDLPNYNFLTEQLTELIGGAAETVNRSEPISLPAATANANWTQRSGSPGTRTAHPALGQAPARIWSASIGSGDGAVVSATSVLAAAGAVEGAVSFPFPSRAFTV